MTEGMRLRPLDEPDLDVLEGMFGDPDEIGVFNWGGFRDSTDWRRRWHQNRLLAEDKSALMIDLAGETLGFVSWHAVLAGPAFRCVEFGISLLSGVRGMGHGTTAQRLLAGYLFDHTQTNRIQALTDVDNRAEQRALEKAGFTREGVLKEYTFRSGRWRDEVLYRMLRTERP
jgi:RimJ/RimL family protein N-acetyltransferase